MVDVLFRHNGLRSCKTVFHGSSSPETSQIELRYAGAVDKAKDLTPLRLFCIAIICDLTSKKDDNASQILENHCLICMSMYIKRGPMGIAAWYSHRKLVIHCFSYLPVIH